MPGGKRCPGGGGTAVGIGIGPPCRLLDMPERWIPAIPGGGALFSIGHMVMVIFHSG
jgi:hypothetical protein